MTRSVPFKLCVVAVAAILLWLSPPVQHRLATIETTAAFMAAGKGQIDTADALLARVEVRARAYGWRDVVASALLVRGEIALSRRQYAEAIGFLQPLVQSHLDDLERGDVPTAWFGLATAKLGTGKTEDAVRDFEAGVAAAASAHVPVAAGMRENFASALEASGKQKEAEEQRAIVRRQKQAVPDDTSE